MPWYPDYWKYLTIKRDRRIIPSFMHKGVTHFSGLPAVSGAAIAAIKVIKASTIR
jgi:hypothetical protein